MSHEDDMRFIGRMLGYRGVVTTSHGQIDLSESKKREPLGPPRPEPQELSDRLNGGPMDSGISAYALKEILLSRVKSGECCPCTKCQIERQNCLRELNQQIDFDSCWYRDGYQRAEAGARRVMTPFGWLEIPE